MTVRMTHPDLPDQPITVSELAVPHYGSAGWEVTDDAGPEPAAPAPDAPATADGQAAEPESDPKTTPRRRGTKETEQ